MKTGNGKTEELRDLCEVTRQPLSLRILCSAAAGPWAYPGGRREDKETVKEQMPIKELSHEEGSTN